MYVEPLLEVFYSNGCLYMVNKFIDQGWNDLYRLANIRVTFSEADIGTIALQLLDQLSHLHKNGIVYKYLRPQHVVVTKGFMPLDSIRLRIADIAIIQMIDLAQKDDRNCGKGK